jgi:hypothetical protein
MDFKGKTLIKLLTVPNDSLCYNGWIGPGLFNTLLIPYRKEREKQVKYDAIIDTRPDIIVKQIPGFPAIIPEPGTLYTTHFNNQRFILHEPTSKFHIGLGDHFFIMTSEVHDIISQRHNHEAPEGPHIKIQQLCEAAGINVCNIPWIWSDITRPNNLDDVTDSRKHFEVPRSDWIALSTSEKKECLLRHNINIEDYITNSLTSSI